MGNIKQKLSNIVEAVIDLRDDFKEALEAKGVSNPGDNIAEYPAIIANLPDGGGEVDWMRNRVRFLDFDGTVLKEQYVEDGQAATPPADPAHPELGLTFSRWGAVAADLAAVYSNLDVVALYNGSFAAMFKIKAAAGDTVTLPIVGVVLGSVDDTVAIEVVWGSGDPDLQAGYPSKTFDEAFEGWVTCSLPNAGAYVLDDNLSSGQVDSHIEEAIIGGAWVNDTGLNPVELQHVNIKAFMACDNAGVLYPAGAFTLTPGSHIAGPLKRLIVPNQTSISISDCDLDFLSAPEATAFSVSTCAVPVIYLPAAVDRPLGAYAYVFVETLALPRCTSLGFGSHWDGIRQIWVGAAGPNAISLPAAWESILKARIGVAGDTLSFPFNNTVYLKKLSVGYGQLSEDGDAVFPYSFSGMLTELNIIVPDGGKINFGTQENVYLTSNKLQDMAFWASFFELIHLPANTLLTVHVNAMVYAIMPDDVKAIATAKGISVSGS